jgi:hypothetical protein
MTTCAFALHHTVGVTDFSVLHGGIDTALPDPDDRAPHDAVFAAVHAAMCEVVRMGNDDCAVNRPRDAVDHRIGRVVRDAAGYPGQGEVFFAVELPLEAANKGRHYLFSAIIAGIRGVLDRTADSAVLSAAYASFGLDVWLSGAASIDYARAVLSVPAGREFPDALRSCEGFWTLWPVCFVSERPSFVDLEAKEGGLMFRFPSGFEVYRGDPRRNRGFV